ncbi:replication-relaxation family protein [Bacillus sp. Gen3]|uniref:replication-relaxation family protein n=1 Tax=Heyndrickxia oleronia TaxID=38875 RepID=UPI0015D23455|nr:replication-relaxation family protein [Bacillus sp. Gen3]
MIESEKRKAGRPPIIDYGGLLFDLYRYRTLTVEQIRQIYFKERENTVYVALHRLKNKGWIDSTCRVNGKGKKVAACYYITEKGLTELIREGKVKNPRRAYDNKPEGKKIPYLIDINDLYTDLCHIGFEMIDAREWKEKYHMNRNSLVKAGLRTPDSKEYGVYLFESDVSEQVTLPRFKREISDNGQSNRFIIFFKGMQAYTKFKKQLSSEELTKGEMCLLPYKFGRRLLGDFPTQVQFVNLFTKYGQVKINDFSNTITNGFSEYILMKKGEEAYICNYLLGNEVALYYLSKYTYDRFQRDGRKVYVFYSLTVNRFTNQNFQEVFREHYPHVKFIGV